MQIDDKICRICVFLMILKIMILAPVVIVSNNAFAQPLHSQTLYEVVKQTPEWSQTAQIDVSDSPSEISFDGGKVYVANAVSDTLSVISTENNTKIKDIPVGDRPGAIDYNPFADTVYVANSGSDTVSVIDHFANEVVAGIVFQVSPFNSGYIVCDDPTTTSPNDLTPPSPIRQYIYVYTGTQCTAKPNPGFEFAS